MLAEEPRRWIGRLNADKPAQPALIIDAGGTQVTWARTGSAPEVEQVTMEQSTDGVSYCMLGRAERVQGGWRRSGLSLPVGQTFYVRARGRTTGGIFNGSSGLVESSAQFYRLAPPFLLPAGVGSDSSFAFVFTYTTGASFTVLATTNLTAPVPDWEIAGRPVKLSGDVYQFSEPAANTHPQRFYLLRSP